MAKMWFFRFKWNGTEPKVDGWNSIVYQICECVFLYLKSLLCVFISFVSPIAPQKVSLAQITYINGWTIVGHFDRNDVERRVFC